jgi:hypothetical protein
MARYAALLMFCLLGACRSTQDLRDATVATVDEADQALHQELVRYKPLAARRRAEAAAMAEKQGGAEAYCYHTIGGVDCYTKPLQGASGRLSGTGHFPSYVARKEHPKPEPVAPVAAAAPIEVAPVRPLR